MHDASCRDYGLTRRALLARAAAVGAGATTTMLFGDVLTQTVYGAGSTNGNVLVVVSLRGGADGLSIVVPYAESAYYAARPGTAIDASALLSPDGTFGLHPALAPLTPLWNAGTFAALHAVGLPSPNRSHFEAMELVEEADPGSSARIGWLNRMIGSLSESSLLEGVAIGDPIMPTSLTGTAPAIAVNDFGDLSMPYPDNRTITARHRTALTGLYGGDGTVLGTAGRQALTLASVAAPVAATADEGPANGASYPNGSDLGTALAQTAALIRSRGDVRAVAVDHGGWDHHSDLLSRMNTQLTELARCLAAFFTDLGGAASRVTVVTLTEFGRRLAQNGAHGLDHGYANAVLVLGAGVRGGRYYSRWPGLSTLDNGDLEMTTDYRDVLASILKRRFTDVALSTVFPGFTATDPLPFASGS